MKASTLSSKLEMKDLSGEKGSIPDQRADPIVFEINTVVQKSGHHICPINKIRVSGLRYVEPEKKYPTGKLSDEELKEHKNMSKELEIREWVPEYDFEVNQVSRNEIELHHLEPGTPNTEFRRKKIKKLKPESVYAPDLNMTMTSASTQKIKAVERRKAWRGTSSRKGEYYLSPARFKGEAHIVNMSNRVREKRENPHDKKWKMKAAIKQT